MKKIFSLLILVLLVLLCSCGKSENEIKVLCPEGIPSIALGKTICDEKYDYTIVSGSSVLSSELMLNNYDIIVSPIILGAQLYNQGKSNYKLESIITLGNSYLVFKEDKKIESLKELEGTKIAAYGQNTAPDIVLKEALISKGVDIEKIEFVYENSVADVLTNRFLIDDSIKCILCAEPVISKIETQLKAKVGNIIKIDLQEELKSEISLIPQAGIFVNKDSGASESSVKEFFDDVKESIEKANLETSDYVDYLLSYQGEYSNIFSNVGKDVLVKSIPNSSMVYLKAYENKDNLDEYFNIINKYNSNILKGENVSEEFYQR